MNSFERRCGRITHLLLVLIQEAESRLVAPAAAAAARATDALGRRGGRSGEGALANRRSRRTGFGSLGSGHPSPRAESKNESENGGPAGSGLLDQLRCFPLWAARARHLSHCCGKRGNSITSPGRSRTFRSQNPPLRKTAKTVEIVPGTSLKSFPSPTWPPAGVKSRACIQVNKPPLQSVPRILPVPREARPV